MRLVALILKGLIVLHSAAIAAYTLAWLVFERQPWLVDALGYILPWLFLPTLILLPAAALNRSRRFTGPALIPVAIFVAFYGHLFIPQRGPAPGDTAFTIMTFNIWDLNDDDAAIVQEIKAHDPGLIGLQELTPEMANSLQERLGSDYPYAEFTSESGILSKWPLLDVNAFRLGGDGHWALKARVEMGEESLTLFNVHPRSPRLRSTPLPIVPFGLPVDFVTAARDRDVADLLLRLERARGPLLVMGDLNLSDRSQGYRALTSSLIDAHRQAGWGLGFSRTHFPRQGIPTWRIDYILYSPQLVALKSYTGAFAGSDHRPVIGQLAFRPEVVE